MTKMICKCGSVGDFEGEVQEDYFTIISSGDKETSKHLSRIAYHAGYVVYDMAVNKDKIDVNPIWYHNNLVITPYFDSFNPINIYHSDKDGNTIFELSDSEKEMVLEVIKASLRK